MHPACMPSPWLTLLVDTLQPLLLLLVSLAVAYLTAWLRTKVQSEKVQHAIARTGTSAEVAVGYVAQTFVDALKKASEDGTLSADDARAARDKALMVARAYLGQKGVDEARKVLGDGTDDALDTWLRGLIEARIAELKK